MLSGSPNQRPTRRKRIGSAHPHRWSRRSRRSPSRLSGSREGSWCLRSETARYHPPYIGRPLEGRELAMVILDVLFAVLATAAAGTALSARIVRQYERGIIFRLGRVLDGVRGPGLTLIVPGLD